MLQFMRKHAQSWLIKVLLGLIIVVFILYFGSSRWNEPAEALVTVNDKVITFSEYRKDITAKVADRIATGFPDVLPKGEWVGNPVRSDIAALPAPGIAEMSMRDVAFLGLAPMRIPPAEGEAGMVALLRSMRDVAAFTALMSKGLSSFSPGMAAPPHSSDCGHITAGGAATSKDFSGGAFRKKRAPAGRGSGHDPVGTGPRWP